MARAAGCDQQTSRPARTGHAAWRVSTVCRNPLATHGGDDRTATLRHVRSEQRPGARDERALAGLRHLDRGPGGGGAVRCGLVHLERRGRRRRFGAADPADPAAAAAGRARLSRAARHRLRQRAGRLHRPAHRLCGGPGPGLGRGAAGAAGGQPAASSPRACASSIRRPRAAAPRSRGDGRAHGRGLCRRATAGRAPLAGACRRRRCTRWTRCMRPGPLQPPRVVAGSALPAFGERCAPARRCASRRTSTAPPR